MRVLSRLISQVKLEGDHKDDDITKKPDLLYTIVTMIPSLEDDELIAQSYAVVGYLFKNNFNSLHFDLDCSESLIDTAKTTLEKEKIDKTVFSNIIKVIGILTNQALITLKNSYEFFTDVAEAKIISLIASKFIPEKEIALVLF